ncbi:MAG TPA: type II secretion system protein, partial [Verrucomicrobiae bacterium]|nr:type II secretion system protein [Verrucomicrobiae bacterium]
MRRFSSIKCATDSALRTPHSALRTHPSSGAFTMIEIMIVVAIMLIVLTMGAPAIYHIWHPESLQK